MFSLQPVSKSLALLVFLVLSPAGVAQQEDVDDSTLMTNYNALREEGQGFSLADASILFEKPDSVVASFVSLSWWCDLEFISDDATTNDYGYVGRAVSYFLGSSLEDVVVQGAQIATPADKGVALSISAVLVPTLGIFKGQFHHTHDDLVIRYRDDGSSTLPILGLEGHDEGDMQPNSDTSAWSGSGTLTKITTEEAAKYLGMDVEDITPAACSMEYKAAWNATHVPDPIDTSVTKLEEEVAQLQADNKELMSRIAAIEGRLSPQGSDSGNDGNPTSTSSSSIVAWHKHDTMDGIVKSMITVFVMIGLFATNFI